MSKSHSHDSGDYLDNDRYHHRRHTSEGVRFSDMSSDHLHRSKNGSDTHQRSYYSGDYNYRTSKEKYRGGERYTRKSERSSQRYQSSRRSQSFDDNEEIENGYRRGEVERESGNSINYGDRGGNMKLTPNRSKSQDSGDRKASRRKHSYEEDDDFQISNSSGESYQTPFYLHSSNSQISSHNGYERIQSSFHDSSEQLERNENTKQKSSRREKTRSSSPRKRHESTNFDTIDTNNNTSKVDRNNEGKRSPKRRAAPAMPLPSSGEFLALTLFCEDLQILFCDLVPASLTTSHEDNHQYEAIPESLHEGKKGLNLTDDKMLMRLKMCSVMSLLTLTFTSLLRSLILII